MAQTKKLKTVDRPMQAWHVTARDAEGSFSNGSVSGLMVDSIWGDHLIDISSTRLGSRIATGIKSYILFTTVIVDGNKVMGYPIEALSDYIAMVTLSQVRLSDGCGALPSILDLFATACTLAKSDSITGADIAYLRALNTVGQGVEYSMQKMAIEIKMKQEFSGRQ